MDALALMDDSQPAERRGRGRPPIPFDPDIAEEICERIAASDKGLCQILSDERALIEAVDQGSGANGSRHRWFPSYATVIKWLSNNAEFAKNYAQARELQADLMVEQVIEISDQSNADLTIVEGKDGEKFVRVNGEAVARSKLRADSRKWAASKLNPRRYGDKLDLTSGGEPLPAPNSVTIDARVQSILLSASARKLMG